MKHVRELLKVRIFGLSCTSSRLCCYLQLFSLKHVVWDRRPGTMWCSPITLLANHLCHTGRTSCGHEMRVCIFIYEQRKVYFYGLLLALFPVADFKNLRKSSIRTKGFNSRQNCRLAGLEIRKEQPLATEIQLTFPYPYLAAHFARKN